MFHRVLAILIGILAIPSVAFPCVPYTGWHVEYHGAGPLRAPAEGPIRVTVADGKSTEVFDLEELRFWVIDSAENRLAGTLELVDRGLRKTVLWTPEQPLTDAGYRVEVRHPAGGGTMMIEALVPTEIPSELPKPEILSARAWERPVGVDEPTCCQLAVCTEGECDGDAPVCESCWHEEYVYPVFPLVQFTVPSTAPTHWLETRYYKVEPDGTETRFDAPHEIQFAEGTAGPFCVVIELFEPQSDRSSRETVCIPEADVVRASHEVDNASKKGRCALSGTQSAVTDGEADDNRDAPTGAPRGGCSTADSSPSVAILMLVALLLAFRRSRERRLGEQF